MTEYKELKKITAAAIYDAGDKNSPCFQEEFQKFLHWGHEHYVKGRKQSQFFFFLIVGPSSIQEKFEDHPQWEKFLIEEGFIEVISGTYKAGDKFEHKDGGLYLLATVADDLVLLVAGDGRSFYGRPPIQVKDSDRITEEEFRLITRGCPEYFTKVEEEQ